MKNPRAILGLILLCGLALIVFLKANPPRPEDPAALITTKDPHDTSTAAAVDDENLPVAAAPADTAADPDVPAAFHETLQSCAPEQGASTLASLLASLESESEGRKETQWRNYTLTWSDGTERRVRVTPKDGAETKYAWEVRLYGVDAEGLPVPEELPGNVEGPQDLARLLGMGEVRGSHEAYQLALNAREHLMVERRDGRIVDFQWRRGDRSMLCSVERCTCLR